MKTAWAKEWLEHKGQTSVFYDNSAFPIYGQLVHRHAMKSPSLRSLFLVASRKASGPDTIFTG